MGGLAPPLILLLSLLSSSEAARLARLLTTVVAEEVTTSKNVKINEGIKFENGVLVTDAYNNVKSSEENDDMDDSILFSEEAMKLMEMLAEDNVTSSNNQSDADITQIDRLYTTVDPCRCYAISTLRQMRCYSNFSG